MPVKKRSWMASRAAQYVAFFSHSRGIGFSPHATMLNSGDLITDVATVRRKVPLGVFNRIV
jgi:hypothetical protein